MKRIEEDLNPCKFRQKDLYIICDGSVAKVTDEDLVRVGSKLENKTFEYIASEFVVLKEFRARNNLEIIPCYMSVRGKKKEQRVIFVNWSESESYMEYKQQKFVMSKFQIKQIIEILKKEVKSKWA